MTDIEWLAEIDSTNDEARRRIEAGRLTGPLWIAARRQTAGRGRGGNEWRSQAGNLAATLCLPWRGAPADAPLLSFVAGLALAEAMDSWVEPARIQLKLPNDVLIDGAKAAGILLERADGRAAAPAAQGAQGATGSQGAQGWIAAGFGVNIHSAPDLPGRATARLVDALRADAPALDAKALLGALDRAWRRWERLAPHQDLRAAFKAQVRPAWLARAHGLGQACAVQLGADRRIDGLFEDLSEDGEMLVRTRGGLEKVAAGEAIFGPARTAGRPSGGVGDSGFSGPKRAG